MTIPGDLQARLSAALPLTTPVLLPDDLETPREGRRPGQAGGLAAYLAEHPGGYLQIGEAQGTLPALGGAAGLWLIQVSAVAATRTASAALCAQARQVLATRAGTHQTPYSVLSPDTTRRDGAVFTTSLILTARKGL